MHLHNPQISKSQISLWVYTRITQGLNLAYATVCLKGLEDVIGNLPVMAESRQLLGLILRKRRENITV